MHSTSVFSCVPLFTDICRAERPVLRDFKGIKIACHAVV
jgi:peptide/nickel transport system ATP-binding protein